MASASLSDAAEDSWMELVARGGNSHPPHPQRRALRGDQSHRRLVWPFCEVAFGSMVMNFELRH